MDWDKFMFFERSLRWYRGLSAKQLLGCNNLLHALRDDNAQESTYRVHKCLQRLGLNPMVTSKQIKSIMSISQLNDLAFLWFIWEAYYKESHDYDAVDARYTVNEQLLLTGIMHLDMMTTMRALDDLLPNREHSKKIIDMQRARELTPQRQTVQALRDQRNPQRGSRGQMSWDAKENRASPYLMSQRRPKPFGPCRIARPKSRTIIFPRYEKYRDRMYHIPNESSRWFATYEPSPIRNEIKRCLSEVLVSIFGDKPNSPESAKCNIHRKLEESIQLRQQELLVEAMNRYKRMLDVAGWKREFARKQVIRRLEEDVSRAAYLLREHARKQLKELQLIIGDNCSGGVSCDMWKKLALVPAQSGPESQPDFSFIMDEKFELAKSAPMEKPMRVFEIGDHINHKSINVPKSEDRNRISSFCPTTIECPPAEGLLAVLNDRVEKEAEQNLGKGDGPTQLRIINEKGKVIDFSQLDSSNDSKHRYISQKTMINGFPRWDYCKVFEPPAQMPPKDLQLWDVQNMIKGYILSALEQPMEQNKSMRPCDKSCLVWKNYNWMGNEALSMGACRSGACVDEAEKCALDFCIGPAMDGGSNQDDSEPSNEAIIKMELSKMTNIDPNNTDQIIELLKMAMEIMKFDRRYVLVTLPNAHMIPELVDWVAERYGRTYGIDEMIETTERSNKLCQRIMANEPTEVNFPFPNQDSLNIPSMGYSELLCHIKKVSADYEKELNLVALEESRLLWLALRGYSNFGSSLEDTFFAYLPTKESDLKRNFVWKSEEHRNVASFRKNRMKKSK